MDYLAHILIFVCIFAILTASFNLLVGYTGLFSVSHAAFFGIGAYAIALLSSPQSLLLHAPVNMWLAMLAATLLAGASGLIIAVPALRVSSNYLVVLSFGFQMVVVGVFNNWVDVTGGEGGITDVPHPALLGYELRTPGQIVWYAVAITALCYFLLWRATSTPFGRMLRAVRDDQVAAQSLGKNVVRVKIIVFVFSAALAGVGGALFAQYVRVVDPVSFRLNVSVEILSMVILGGTGNLLGSALGAGILVVLPEVLRFMDIGDLYAEQTRQVVFGILLVIMLRFRSQGILPEYWVPGFLRRRALARIRMDLADLEQQPAGALSESILGKSKAVPAGQVLLRVENVSKSFGGIQALSGFSLALEAGKITGLIGPNGAGKTTAFNLMTGFLNADKGRITLNGQEITQVQPHLMPALGVSRSFQNLRLFQKLTVLDNVMVARPRQAGERLWYAIFRIAAVHREARANQRVALEILRFVGLADKALELADNLSYAEEKLLVLARMLAMETNLLLLDEPASGLDPNSLEGMFSMIRQLVKNGMTVCIIEHNLDVIKELSTHIVYLDEGRVFAEGPIGEIMQSQELAERYFGV
jgi:branched-chain amino acid transport system ATP-binding protein/branched-chain amino acid transport system permease protein